MTGIVQFICVALFIASATAAPKAGTAPLLQLNDGRYIPHLALGTFLGFKQDGAIDNEEVVKAVEWAIDAGYRHIDTASIYADEDQVGKGVNNKIKDGTIKREDVFVTTKLWNDKHAKEQVVPALRESLQKLNLDYVDMYLIHWPVSYSDSQEVQNIDLLDTWKGMEEAKTLGLAKSIGISNFNETQIQRILDNSETKPALLQIEVNPNLTQQKLIKYSKEKGIVVMAYSPFGSLVPSRSNKDTPAPKIDDPTLVAIGKKYGKSTPQIVLRYLVDRGLIPIPKSINKDRIEQNINIFDFQLTPEEVTQIDSFNKDYRVVLPSFWQNHPEYPFERLEHPENSPF